MDRGELLYEGKAKQLYATPDPDLLIQHFKDDATAFNAKKRGTIVDKGILNNRMSEVLFRFLEEAGVPTHFVRRLSERDMLIRRCEIGTGEKLDKDRFRRDLGGVEDAYQEAARRICSAAA